MIAAIQLLEYLHYHFTPRIYVTLYNVNTSYKDILNARKQADLFTKNNETKRTCCLQNTCMDSEVTEKLSNQVSTGELQRADSLMHSVEM